MEILYRSDSASAAIVVDHAESFLEIQENINAILVIIDTWSNAWSNNLPIAIFVETPFWKPH